MHCPTKIYGLPTIDLLSPPTFEEEGCPYPNMLKACEDQGRGGYHLSVPCPRLDSKEQGAKSKEQRAGSKEQGAKSK